MKLVHARDKDLQIATITADTSTLLNEAGETITNEAGDEILSETTSSWTVKIIPIKYEANMTKIYKEVEFGVHEIEALCLQFVDFSSVELVTSVYSDGIAIFKNGTGQDLSSTHMPNGAASVTGNIITTPPITSLLGGNYYMLAVVVTVNGTSQQKHAYVRINCVKEKSGLMRTR